MLWIMPQTAQLLQSSKAHLFLLDMCAFGSEHMKSTTFACSHVCFSGMVRKCPGLTLDHVHVPFQGTVLINGREVFRTKLAQVYPDELCKLFACQWLRWLLDAHLRSWGRVQSYIPLAQLLEGLAKQ